MKRAFVILMLLSPFALLLGVGSQAQRGQIFDSAEESRAAYERAIADQQTAQRRSLRLEAEARDAVEVAEKTSREAAALAARIQEAEAGISAAEARIALIDDQRGKLRRRLADRQIPLMRLTASLQNFSRRPVALSVFQPGSVKDVVYLRAMLNTTIPEVRRRTDGLRAEIERGRVLQQEAEQAAANLRADETVLSERRSALSDLETRQRLASRQKTGEAARESQRALGLAEQARDLNSLVDQLDKAGTLRERLATLPGPLPRPARPREAQVDGAATPPPDATVSGALAGYRLPVSGRTLAGFGVPTPAGALSSGLTLAPRESAQVVAPAAGRVAFSGPYRGYGQIVIIEHKGGWTSLVTGLARADAAVGDELIVGSPLGVAAPRDPQITVELRRGGEPVNPLEFLD